MDGAEKAKESPRRPVPGYDLLKLHHMRNARAFASQSMRYEAEIAKDEDGKEAVAKAMEDGTVSPIILRL
ncbi:hypothetical protein EMCRGX_G008506 [Ephydatia muelleri]